YSDVTGAIEFGTTTNHTLLFLQNNAEAMRLTSTGLGIGTSSPSYKLDVSAGSGVGIRLKSTGAYGTFRADNTGTTGGGLYTASQNGVQCSLFGIDGAILGNTSTDTAIFSDVVGGSIKLYTNASATAKATLDSSGNLGLGVTPSASTLPIIQSTYGVFSGNTNINIMNNAYYNSGWKYVGTGLAAQYQQDTGKHIWYTAASGTAGNPITFTQAATLTANGDYLVGTTTDVGSSSNTKKVVGGNFRTFQNTATIPALSTATILTLSSSVTGVYIVNANFGPQGNAIYGGMLIVVANNGSFRIVTNGSGASSALTMSGANVQITNALGSPLDATGSVMFIGN
ncbi:hypothetical protein EBT25_13550, partial [bacterium]|nr:hypothetical protein [bacterium]